MRYKPPSSTGNWALHIIKRYSTLDPDMCDLSHTIHLTISGASRLRPRGESDFGCVAISYTLALSGPRVQRPRTPKVYEARPFTRLKQLKYLSRTNQLDEEFFWR